MHVCRLFHGRFRPSYGGPLDGVEPVGRAAAGRRGPELDLALWSIAWDRYLDAARLCEEALLSPTAMKVWVSFVDLCAGPAGGRFLLKSVRKLLTVCGRCLEAVDNCLGNSRGGAAVLVRW